MTGKCDVGKLLEEQCHKLDFSRTTGMYNIADLSADHCEELLWRAGLLPQRENITTLCKHHEQYFGDAFIKKQKKCCDVWVKHKRKVAGDRLITLEMAKKLREMEVAVVPGHKFCRTCEKHFDTVTASPTTTETETETEAEGTEPDSPVDDHDFVVYETPRKKVNLSLEAAGISPINLHSLPQHARSSSAKMDKFKTDLSQVYHIDSEEIPSTSTSTIDSAILFKAQELDRLHNLIKEKLKVASFPEKVQLLTLVPDSWSRTYAAKEFSVSEYLIRKARELKHEKGILAVPNPKRGKTLLAETVLLVTAFYEDDEYSRQLPGKKDCVSIGNKQYKQKRLVLCNLKELYIAFKEKHPDVHIGLSKFSSLRPKWCVIAGASGTHSVCVCTHHQNAKLLVDAINWDHTYKDLTAKVVCSTDNRICMMHRCEHCPGIAALRTFLDKELEDFDDDAEFHYTKWETTDRATLATLTTTCDIYKQLLIECIDDLTKHSYLAKCQGQYLKTRKENLSRNEVIILGDFAENYQFMVQDEIQSFHWSKTYCTLHPIVIYFLDNEGNLQHHSLCFISNDNNHDTAFVYEVQTMTAQYIKHTNPHINNFHYFSDGCAGQYKNYKNFINLCYHQQDFGVDALWTFFATSHGKSPCDGIGGFVKRHVAKRSLQRPMKNQILDYKAVLEVCFEELTHIKFFDISEERRVVVRESLVARLKLGRTIPGTRSSHHFIPTSTSSISHYLTSEDTKAAASFNFDSTPQPIEVNPTVSSYVTCVYDTFWWVGLVEQVNDEHRDCEVKFLHPHGPGKNFRWPTGVDKCNVPFTNILCSITPPTMSSSTARSYTISDTDFDNTIAAFERFG